ncbi:hypothetical protein Gogos_018849 [Gossypium gossypioides]|uniref:TF-B3 domain-containing protein n=1 Tax=Gossypium gossypioides TaxID=34282 RepID=A0A7J9BFL0_GOSGO|nr:hypothetical protein [Gossypium gossypioides]
MAGAFKSENPFFVVVLQPSHVHGNKLSVPMNFARKYLTMMHKKSYISFQMEIRGQFAVDNNLEVGDVCVFEPTGGIETSMKVTIYKKQAIEDENLG